LVEDTVLAQYGARVGSLVSIGDLKVPVLGSLQKVPGETVMMATISPRVYIALADLPKTRLLGRGSMARYKVYFQLPPQTGRAGAGGENSSAMDKYQLSYDTVGKRRRSLGGQWRMRRAIWTWWGLWRCSLGGWASPTRACADSAEA
jgi:putative ABC transport system permease protein